MINKEYWEKRLKDRFKYVDRLEEELYDRYLAIYKTTLTDYVKLLKPYRTADGYNFTKLQQDLQFNPSFNYTVGRYQAMFDTLDAKIQKLGVDELAAIDRHLISIFKTNYYDIFYEMEKAAGYNLSFSLLSENRLNQVLHTAWAADGKEFSDRIWRDKTLLSDNLRNIIEDSIAAGENPRKTASRLKEATGNTFYNSQRVIRTETTAIITESDKAAYLELGFERYMYNAVFDKRTSNLCGKMDSQTFPLSQMKVGTNAPPLHPNCRSTIEPVIPGAYQPPFKYGKDGFGQRIQIPSNLTFDQFKELHNIP